MVEFILLNNLIVVPVPDYFLPRQYLTRFFHNISFIQPSCNHDYYLYSYLPRTIRDEILYQVTFMLVQSTYHFKITVPCISEIIDRCLISYLYFVDFFNEICSPL